MTPLIDVLKYAETGEVLTPEVLEILKASSLSGMSAEEIIAMNSINFAELMEQKELFIEDNAGRLKIAKAVLALIEESGISAAPVLAAPQKIEVTMPKMPDQMTAAELLKQLAENPQDIEALRLLRTKEPVASASRMTDEWAIKKDGALDVEATLSYCIYLGKKGATIQRQYKGGLSTTLENALGIKEKALINPLIEGEIIQEGLDSSGNDWTNISRELMKAILWARRTGHQFYPKIVDPIDTFDEISATPLPRRWAGILADYQRAVEEEELGTEINLTWSEGRKAKDPKPEPVNKPAGMEGASEQQGRPTEEDVSDLVKNLKGLVGILTGEGEETLDKEGEAERYVRAMSQGDLNQSGMDNRVTGVFNNLKTSGMCCKFMAVVIGSADINGMDNTGIIYAPPGVPVKIQGMDSSLQKKTKSWEELAAIVKSL